MGLKTDPNHPVWGCFRNPQHRGTAPAYLIAKLLGIRYESALELTKAPYPIDSYEEAIENLKMPPNAPGSAQLGAGKNRPLTIPPEFKRLKQGGFKADRFFQYLSIVRGFGNDAYNVADYAHLRYALSGEQAYRLIFPVHAPNGFLVGWTGRSIAHNAPVRYLTMPGMGKDVVYGYDAFVKKGRQALLIVEGPMDALKLNFYGTDIHAIATMGTSFTDGQLATIVALRHSFRKMIVVSDRSAVAEGMLLAEALSTYARQDVQAVQMPGTYKDPGEMPKEAIQSFCSELVK